MVLKVSIAAALLIIVFMFLATSSYQNKRKTQNYDSAPLPTTTQMPNPYVDTFDGYRLSWVEVRNVDDIYLYSNLSEKKTSSQVFDLGRCKYVISAGFYNKQNNHIGLFVADGKMVSKSIQDDFFDGYFYIKDSKATISLKSPSEADIAIQSGPVIMQNNQFLLKSYPNDDYSRRILVGTSRKGNVIFISIYGDNKISGPRLGDLKTIISKFEERSSVDLVEILNLDGGSHSAFITDAVKISEISTIGSYFCVSK